MPGPRANSQEDAELLRPGLGTPPYPSGLEAPLPHGVCLWRHLSVVLMAQGGAGPAVAALLPKCGRMHPCFTGVRQAEAKQSSG